LAYNSIKTLPTDIITLPELEYLNIAGNQISSIPAPPYSCPRMVCMIMHSNNLTKFPDFPSMPAVETLDLACNDLKKMPQLQLFRRLKMLDLSHNKNIEIQLKDLENFRYLQYFGLLGIETDVQSVRKALGDCVDIDETSQTHDLWSFGTAHIRGTNISKTGDICMTHITVPAMNDNSGLFGVVDGGKAPDASLRIKKKLPSIVNAEITASAQRTNNSSYAKSPLLYLEHSFLTMHRKLGDIGLKFGASMVVVHLCRKSNGEVTANIGNVGLGEAILCCRGQVTPLVSPHSPSTNKDEIYRVVKEKGFISEDDRINGICGVSRLVGCYYLHPQVIPLPTTQSISLPSNSNYIIIASHGLWKYLSYKEIGKMSKSSYHPANFARKLADQAIGCGCPLDVSVLVVKLDFPKDSTPNRESNGYQSNRQSGASGIAFEDEIIYESDDLDEEDEEGGDENYTTNIDDIMEEAFQNDEPINIKDDSCLSSEALRSISPDQLDALVLGSSPEVTDLPIVNDSASERDSLILQGSHTQLDETVEESNMPPSNIENLSALPLPTNGIDNRRVSVISSENQSFTLEDDTPLEVLEDIPQIPLEDISRTFPMRAAKLKKINFPVENSFEQTQSIQAVCSDQADIDDEDDIELTQEQLEIKRRFSAPNVDLLVMNEAIAKLGGDSVEKISSSHSVRSKPSRQRSFVQASYSKLSRHSVSNSSLA
jgi:serine/threonine protein phosphatase PrpC